MRTMISALCSIVLHFKVPSAGSAVLSSEKHDRSRQIDEGNCIFKYIFKIP